MRISPAKKHIDITCESTRAACGKTGKCDGGMLGFMGLDAERAWLMESFLHTQEPARMEKDIKRQRVAGKRDTGTQSDRERR